MPADDMAELSALNDQRNRRRRRRLSSQQATSLSQDLHQQPILSTDLVGTYSCHGIDANRSKINQDAAAIAYPLAGDQHAALFVVVDGHGRLGHDVTAEVRPPVDLAYISSISPLYLPYISPGARRHGRGAGVRDVRP